MPPPKRQPLGALALDDVLGLLAAPAPTPAGGSAAALTAAIASSLVVMVGRGSPAWPEGDAVAGRASALRARLTSLAEEDVVSLSALLDFLRDTRDVDEGGLSSALVEASRPALSIVEAAAEIAELAADAEMNGKPIMRADAAVALVLATAASGSALQIVETNLRAPRAGELKDAESSMLLQRARTAAKRASSLALPAGRNRA